MDPEQHIKSFTALYKELNKYIKAMKKCEDERELSELSRSCETVIFKLRHVAPFLHEDLYILESNRRRKIREA